LIVTPGSLEYNSNMELDKQALAFGSLMNNVLSLEFLIRAFLLEAEGNPEDLSLKEGKLYELNEGDEIPLNAFTRDKYFGQVVKKYNENTRIKEEGLSIDNTVVDIRNALAHGMIFGLRTSPPLKLLHFSKERNKVRVKLNVLMTIDWFNEQIRQVRLATDNVEEAIRLVEIERGKRPQSRV